MRVCTHAGVCCENVSRQSLFIEPHACNKNWLAADWFWSDSVILFYNGSFTHCNRRLPSSSPRPYYLHLRSELLSLSVITLWMSGGLSVRTWLRPQRWNRLGTWIYIYTPSWCGGHICAQLQRFFKTDARKINIFKDRIKLNVTVKHMV